jgi:uncharacterized protein (DUF58 family)
MVREFTREEDSRVLLVLDPHSPATENTDTKTKDAAAGDPFERSVTICANLAWHFYQGNSQLQFRGVGFDTLLAPAEENIFKILRHLATVQQLPYDPEQKLMTDLGAFPEIFKIVVTRQPRGSIPYSVWSSSYLVFANDLV